MVSFDFDSYSSLGIGMEAFAMLEEQIDSEAAGEPEAEAQVGISVNSGEDQQDYAEANTAEDEVESVADTGAQLFKDCYRLASIKETLKQHPLDQSLYAYLNMNNQLDNILKVQLPAVESMSAYDNSDVKEGITKRLDALFSGTVSTNINKFFGILDKKLQKLQYAVDDVTINRRVSTADLIFRMEDDNSTEETSEEVSIKSDDEGGSQSEVDTSEAPASTEPTETTDSDVNSSEECNSLMNAIDIFNFDRSPIVQNLDAAANGDTKALEKIKYYTRKLNKSLSQFRSVGHKNRIVKFNKHNFTRTLKAYYNLLQEFPTVNKLYFAMHNLSKSVESFRMNKTEDFSKILPKFQTIMLVQTYLTNVKKAMDCLHYNLKFVSAKFNAKH